MSEFKQVTNYQVCIHHSSHPTVSNLVIYNYSLKFCLRKIHLSTFLKVELSRWTCTILPADYGHPLYNITC